MINLDKLMKDKNSFLYWLLEKRDIDGLVIAILVSNAIGMFTKDISTGFIEPLIAGFLPTNKDDEQVLKVWSLEFRFKLQYIVAGFLKASVNLWIAYLIVTFVYKKLLNLK
jgi:large-conductance mechanosensitive channel